VIPEDPALAGREIVPLALQLLVENAVKHNVVSTEKPLLVEVKVTDQSVVVVNNLQLRPAAVDSTGLGQQNIRQR
jgi:LytS/YehU family sensor histidine kinase